MKSMRRSLLVLGACSAVLAGASAVQAASVQQELATANVGMGHAEFSSCAVCHGAQGEGGRLVGAPKIAGMPAAAVLGMLNVYHKGQKIGPKSYYMNAVTGHMSASELANVAAYVATIGKDVNNTLTQTEPTD